MTGRRWMILTFVTIAALVAASAAVAFAIDPYGLLRDSKGRKLVVYFSDRRVKYLMSERYVPANFEGLLLGPSVCELWDPQTINGVAIFNECAGGENAVEAQMLANQALARGHYKLAVFLVVPTMVSAHDVKDEMDSTSASQGIWSIHAMLHEMLFAARAAHIRIGHENSPNGQVQFGVKQEYLISKMDPTGFQIDPIALKALQDSVVALRNNGAAIVYVVPPLYGPYYEFNKPEFEAFEKTLQSRLPRGVVIDCNRPEYDELRFNRRNFQDRSHASPAGSAAIVSLLARVIPAAIAERRQASVSLQEIKPD